MPAAARRAGEAPRAALAGVPVALEELVIESLDAEGRGVARNSEGKVCFVEGALPGERVLARAVSARRKFDFLKVESVLSASAARVTPGCAHFGVCGGCASQHADMRTQVAAKQRWLEDNLARIGKVSPEIMLPIVYGESWRYRRRARLSVRYVPGKGGALVGFREKRSTYIADMRECRVLPDNVAQLIPHLRRLVGALSIKDRIPQIEVAAGDNATALVFRH